MHLREVVSKAARSLGIVRRAGKLFNCPRGLKSYFNAYVLFNLEYCACVWMSSADSHLIWLESVVRSAERLCEGDLCYLGHRKKVSVLCLLHEIYHKAGHLCKSIYIILLQLVILALLLLCVS